MNLDPTFVIDTNRQTVSQNNLIIMCFINIQLSEEDEEEADDASDVEAEDPKVIKELIDLIKKVGSYILFNN